MAIVQINKNPSRKDLRLFAGVWLPLFAAIAGFQAWRHGSHGPAVNIWVGAGIVSVVCLAVPAAARLVYVGLSYVTFPIGWVASHVILFVAYYFVFTPIGLLMRLFRYDAMKRRFEKDAKTYWAKREEPANVDRYFQQF